ncbi:MAG: BlaI/MecI/CopY family transcriptional regulator [Lachnospiraceae bacterium]|nr:BlaI/MecI/CopY family transcriptional regulator [Lachnospiraceae bacterium]
MEKTILYDGEYKFMQIVWDAAPVNSGELVRLCRERLGWKKSTTYTTIKKLCEKGYIVNEHATVSVRIPREEAQSAATASFVDRTFDGSLPGFIAAFLNGRKITESEAKRIQSMIDEYRGD